MRGWTRLFAFVLLVGLAVPAARAQEAPAEAAETHTVRSGDTLYSIARRYGLTVEVLQRLNDLEGTTIKIGQELVVEAAPVQAAEEPPAEDAPPAEEPPAPSPPEEEEPLVPIDTAEAAPPEGPAEEEPVTPEAPAEGAPAEDGSAGEEAGPASRERAGYGQHVVEAGETLYDIAARYGVPADTLRLLNDDLPSYLEGGGTLRLPPAWGVPTHRVAEGETLYDLAARYGVSVRTWMRVNDLEAMEVEPGQVLRIPGRRAPQPPPRGRLPEPAARGLLTVYPPAYEGRLMASGAPYAPEDHVVSHRDLPFGTVVLLVAPGSGRRTFARVADRGPFDEQYLAEVSAAVAAALGLDPEARQPVELYVVDRGGSSRVGPRRDGLDRP